MAFLGRDWDTSEPQGKRRKEGFLACLAPFRLSPPFRLPQKIAPHIHVSDGKREHREERILSDRKWHSFLLIFGCEVFTWERGEIQGKNHFKLRSHHPMATGRQIVHPMSSSFRRCHKNQDCKETSCSSMNHNEFTRAFFSCCFLSVLGIIFSKCIVARRAIVSL